MKVLSLFDGMSCGQIAFTELGMPIDEYYAYEVDKYAIQVTQHNFSNTIQCGDVFKADFTKYEDIDWLIGGSPCTYWSIAQKNNRETEASGMGWELFSQYVRALKEAKPKYFLYENNKSMSQAIRESINKAFGFEAIGINSALLSAQNRQRLYWIGIRQEDGSYKKANIEQPKDKGILLKDILINGNDLTNNDNIIEPVSVSLQVVGRKKNADGVFERTYEAREDGKSSTITSVEGRRMVAEPIAYCNDKNMEHLMRPYGSKAKVFDEDTEKSSTLMTAMGTGDGNRIYYAEKTKPDCLNSKDINGNQPSLADRIYNIDGKATACTTGYIVNVAEPIRVGTMPQLDGDVKDRQQTRIYSIEGKSVVQSAQGGGWGAKTGLYAIPNDKDMSNAKPIYEVKNGYITIKDKQYPIKLKDGYYIIRKLYVRECARLQTIPEWYDFSCISNSQAYKCLGNGWTVEVIKYLIQSTLNNGAVIDCYQDNLFNLYLNSINV